MTRDPHRIRTPLVLDEGARSASRHPLGTPTMRVPGAGAEFYRLNPPLTEQYNTLIRDDIGMTDFDIGAHGPRPRQRP
jgi:hypothetical protein